MSSLPDQFQSEVRRIVERFEDRLQLARAMEMASCNRLLEAEALLCPGGMMPQSADGMDLLARIYVQQGRFDLARRRWEEALKLGGRQLEFENCLKVLDDYTKQVFRRRLLIWKITLILLIATLLICVGVHLNLLCSTK
jgi:hypothetical protein